MYEFKTKSIDDTEMVYSILREKYPDRQIEIEFNDNTKEYLMKVTNEKYTFDPEVPLDLKIKVVYGDSVTGDTPLLLKKDGLVHIETISSIFNESDTKFEYPGFKMFDQSIRLEKEYALTDYQIWTDNGWTDIKKVIRHKCDKKLYRMLTHTGCVDVTEYHSLLTDTLEKVKPGELKVGDALMHTFPTEFVEQNETIVKMEKEVKQTKICKKCNLKLSIDDFYKSNAMKHGRSNTCKYCEYYKKETHPLRNISINFEFKDYILTEKEAEVWGFFQGDGSCGGYNCKSCKKYSWALNNNNMDRLKYFKDILESVEPIKFKILDTLKSSGVYKLVPTGSIKYMVDKYRKLFYYQKDCNAEGDKYKIVPNCILNASKDIKRAYFKGYYEADGAKTCGNSVEKPSFAVKGKIGAQCMYYLLRSLGYNIGINITYKEKKESIYFLDYTTFKCKKENAIKKIVELPKVEDYVYDIETTIGRFGGVGVGQLEVLNTDSCFLRFKYNRDDFEKNRFDTFKFAITCGENLTHKVFKRPPIDLEFEKVYQPFVLLTKKRYIGKKFEDTKDPLKLKTITTAGIAITRRDFCLMVKNCYKDVIDCIMETEDLKQSCQIYKNYVDKIRKYDVDVNDLVVSAMLAKTYACSLCKEKSEWSKLICPKPSCKENNVSKRLQNCSKCGTKFKCIHTFSLGHVNLGVKLLQRTEEISVNDRIQYLYIETGDPKAKKADIAEDPKYANEHGLKFNRICYLEQLAKTLLAFFKVVLNDHNDLMSDLLDYTNDNMVLFGAKKFKPSDFKLDLE